MHLLVKWKLNDYCFSSYISDCITNTLLFGQFLETSKFAKNVIENNYMYITICIALDKIVLVVNTVSRANGEYLEL